MLVICSSNSLRLVLENVDFLGVWQCKCKVFFGVSGVGVGGGGKFSSLHFLKFDVQHDSFLNNVAKKHMPGADIGDISMRL